MRIQNVCRNIFRRHPQLFHSDDFRPFIVDRELNLALKFVPKVSIFITSNRLTGFFYPRAHTRSFWTLERGHTEKAKMEFEPNNTDHQF